MAKTIVILQNSVKTVYLFRKSYIRNFLRSGIEVVVVAPNDCSDSVNKLTEMGVHVNVFKSKEGILKLPYMSLAFLKMISKYSRSDSFFICHFIMTFFLCYPWLLGYGRYCTLVYVEGLGSALYKNYFLRLVAKFMLSHHFFKTATCNWFERESIGNSSTYVTGGIGIDLSKFKMVNKTYDNKIRLLYVGRLIADKGVNDTFVVLRNLINLGLEVSLTLVGNVYLNNPSSLTSEQIILIEKEFGSHVKFTGFQDDIVQYYHSADVLILPSRLEGFPVCVMEANAMGLPVFCYDVPGCHDAVSDGINGYIAKPFDTQELTYKINQYFLNMDRRKISLNCSNYARDNFDQEVKSSVLYDLINGKNEFNV
ncbi:TPA: glycosyltransferase [Photobacterium damselae]